MIRIACLFWVILRSMTAYTQVTVDAFLSNDSILVGQPAAYILEIKLSESIDTSEISWFIPSDSLASGLEIIKISTENRTNAIRKKILFRAEKKGFYPIPPVLVEVKGKTIEVSPLLVVVFSTLTNPNNERLRSQKESIEINYSLIDWLIENWHWILISHVVIGALLLIIQKEYNSKKPNLTTSKSPPEPITPPYIVAINKLNELEKIRLWETGELKEFHSAISFILREYFEGELGISALEKTTFEILKDLKPFHFPLLQEAKIKELLSLTDLVKFAKQKPTNTENKAVLKDSKDVIDHIYNSIKRNNVTED